MNFQKLIFQNHQKKLTHINVGIAPTITLEVAINEFLYHKASYAPSAAARYKDRLIPFAEFIGAHQYITDITVNDIIRHHEDMRSKDYSPKTIEYSCIILKNLFTFWLGRGICGLNPAEIRSMKCLSPSKELITKGDFEQMCEALDECFFEELSRKLALNLLWDCGMRVSELCGLDISDIQESDKPGLHCAKIKRRKSMRYNLVVWSEETNRLLNLYLGMRLSFSHTTDALFVSRNKDCRLTSRTIQRWVKEIAEMALIEKKLTPHCFRHSKAHRILDVGENIRDVQSILGHSSPVSSFHYLSLSAERQYQVSKKYLGEVA